MEDTIKANVLDTFAEYYAKGAYPDALAELEIQRSQVPPGLWHFNAGTVKAKMGLAAEARFHFLKAQLEGYSEQNLGKNLDLVEEKLELTSLEKPLTFSDYAVKFGLWSQGGFFSTLALLILVTGLLILRREKKTLILGLTVIFCTIPLALSAWVHSWDKAVIVSEQEIREGPSAIFASRGEIPEGVLVVLKKSGDWYEVFYPARFQGWIKNSGFKELE